MGTVTIRELLNRGGDVIDRVLAGEHLTITRPGTPVAEPRRIGHGVNHGAAGGDTTCR